MTDLLHSPVTRRTTCKFKGRRVYVTLRTDDQIEFRLEHLSETIVIDILEILRSKYGAAGSSISLPARRGK